MSKMMRGNFRMALAGVSSAKWRSFLTMLGVIIGIVSVVTVVGIGEGVKRQVIGAIDQFGSDLITVKPGQQAENGGMSFDSDIIFGGQYSGGLTVQDADTVKQVASVDKAAPLGQVSGIVQAGDKRLHGGKVIATSADLPAILQQDVAAGGFWGSEQEGGNFAVVGQKAALDLFADPVPLGKKFSFRSEEFIVRGVFADFASVPFSPTGNFDSAVFIPYQTAARLTENRAGAYALLARPHDPKHYDQALSDITDALAGLRGGEQDFAVLSPDDHMAVGNDVLGLLSTWVVAVAAISLLIGGVGLMNIMLVSVTERMHEIGVRKAIGATNRQIMMQFMLEAIALSSVGGIIGIALSVAAHFTLLAYTDLQPVLSWQAIVIATLVSLAIGTVFGTAPAIKAARKHPIEALRHE